MGNKLSTHFLDNQKHRTAIIACVIIGIHYVVTYFLDASKYPSLGLEIYWILTKPSYILSTLIGMFLWSYNTPYVVIIDWQSYTTPYILTSSLIYGIVLSLLVSKKTNLRWIGVAFIFLCLLILAVFWLMAAAAQSFA